MKQTQKTRTEIAINWGFDLTASFFELPCDELAKLEKLRKSCGYRGDNNLGRSRDRQFWYYLQNGFSKLYR